MWGVASMYMSEAAPPHPRQRPALALHVTSKGREVPSWTPPAHEMRNEIFFLNWKRKNSTKKTCVFPIENDMEDVVFIW